MENKYKFIDLFAGLGGFHLALSSLGCECVFASELREDLRRLYAINFPGTRIEGDITKIDPKDIPAHDILCAGFPCQPFSQAGKRQGFSDEKERGNLFYNITGIIKEHRPRYVFLENVSNLKGHDNGNTWNTIKHELESLNYEVAEPQILSPHEFNIPQHRRRIYIVCENREYGHLEHFSYPSVSPNANCDINSIIDKDERNYQSLKPATRHQLQVWQEFLNLCDRYNTTVPSFPIWAMEFGATYDYVERVPFSMSLDELRHQKGILGQQIEGETRKECLSHIPSYARADTKKFPSWKIKYISQNRQFYAENKKWIDKWKKNIETFAPSHQKLEWNCGKAEHTLDDKIIQFRASGIRVKLPTFSPALNLVGTQIPIFPWIDLPKDTLLDANEPKGRYMTIHEASKIQGMESLKFGNDSFRLSDGRCFEALGNAVNVTIIKKIAKNLIKK